MTAAIVARKRGSADERLCYARITRRLARRLNDSVAEVDDAVAEADRIIDMKRYRLLRVLHSEGNTDDDLA